MNQYKIGEILAWLCLPLAFVGFLWLIDQVDRRWQERHKPTADELYGCTVKQQAPNGDCR